jgi:uncharacterized membrane protein
MTTDRPGPAPSEDSLESSLARVLQAGTYVSIALIAVGSVLLLSAGISPLAGSPSFQPADVIGDVLAARPAGFLWLGIVAMMATPSLRVVGALVGFWRRGERTMVAVAILVLAVVGAGVVIGLLTG